MGNSDKSNWRKCKSKSSYPSFFIARKHAKKYEKLRGVKLRTYECRVCGQYHITKREYNAR